VASRTHPVRKGAAEVAPTAPHATPRDRPTKEKSGPERFWDLRRVRIAFVVSACLSIAVHWAVAPWTVRSGLTFELRDVEGDLVIPVDLLAEDEPPPPVPPPPSVPPPVPGRASDEGLNARDAAPPPRRDAGPPDAQPRDAEIVDARMVDADTSDAEISDGGPVPLADAGALAIADAAPGAGGPRDPVGMLGAVGQVQPGEVLVTLLLNVEAIRAHPAGPRLSKLVRAAPQWDDALKGTTVDPVRDADWVAIYGPSLIHTERDAILVGYSVPDAVADAAIEAIRRRSHNGAAFDAGVPGVKATLAHADRAPRVFLRPRSHLIAVVPPDYATTAAKLLSKTKGAPHVRPGEAMRMTLKNPHRPIPQMPARIKELRVWVLPLADGGAEIHGEGECSDAPGANDSTGEIKSFLQRFRGSMEGAVANMISRGLINAIEVSSDGNLVRFHAHANREQVDAVIGFVGAQLGADVNAPASAASGGSVRRP